MTSVDVNVYAVIICVLIGYVLGWLWYSPVLFGKKWIESLGYDPIKAGAHPAIGLMFQFPSTLLKVLFVGLLVFVQEKFQIYWIVPIYIMMLVVNSIAEHYWAARSPNVIIITAGLEVTLNTIFALIFWLI